MLTRTPAAKAETHSITGTKVNKIANKIIPNTIAINKNAVPAGII
jgi:hypothetical protein